MEESLVSVWNILIGGGFLYTLYYLKFAVRKPILHCNDRQLAFLERHVPILFQRFWPTFYFCEPRLQTVFRDFFMQTKHINYIRELLTLPDGEVVAMDWSEKFYVRSEVSNGDVDDVSEEDRKRPIVIIIPGLVGTSRDAYTRRMIDQCDLRGFRGVVLNYRGSAGMGLINDKPYCATHWQDLDHAVGWLREHHPQAPIMAVGLSLGGVILANFIASNTPNNHHHLTCAMAISIGWDFIVSNQSLAKPINYYLFNKHLTERMIRIAKKYKDNFAKYVDFDAVVKSKSIVEFDNNFTCHVFGFKDANDYYHHSSCYYKIHDIKVPFLDLNSEDDPFAPIETIPTAEAPKTANVVIATTSRGGHIGFVDALWKGQREGYYERVFGQYATAMFQQGSELKVE